MKCPVCKKNISDSAVKCPYCKTRTGLQCSNCNTVNKLGSLKCKSCGTELLKICGRCNSVNFPVATKCRKCGASFEVSSVRNIQTMLKKDASKQILPHKQAVKILSENILLNDIKIFSLTGPKGCGKTTLLKRVIDKTKEKLEWCYGRCSSYTQITPGGVLRQLLLNLFNLPEYYSNKTDLKNDATKFFANEFKFLNNVEVLWLLNFLYNSNDGNYEDIIINKKQSYFILYKIFKTLVNTGQFVFVIDDFDFIDGFSIEFLSSFIQEPQVLDNLKLLVIHQEARSVINYFPSENLDLKSYLDINISYPEFEQLEEILNLEGYADTFISEKQKYIISETCKENPAYIEQAVFYGFDCQIANKEFELTESFETLVKARVEMLKSSNPDAFKILAAAAILENKIQLGVLRQVFDYDAEYFAEIISYLEESKFIKRYNENYYEFQNTYLWGAIVNALKEIREFEEVNIRVAKCLSAYELNIQAPLTTIALNLKEYRMAFDIWTKIARLASNIGDINLYVVGQKQCLALLNEFNENETLNIRYNISERLGKLLAEYDPEAAIEFLPDAISNARVLCDDTKEIELLGYLAQSCKKVGNYYGEIECADNTLKKLSQPGQELESALVKATKIPSLIKVGNCGEVVNLVDNDILPRLNKQLEHPRLDKSIPLELIYDYKLKSTFCLAQALCLQGNNRAFDVLTDLSDLIKKHQTPDSEFVCKIKLVQAFSNTIKGDYKRSNSIMQDIINSYGENLVNLDTLNSSKSEIINAYSLVSVINKLMQRDYQNIQEELFEAVSFANDTGDSFTKHLLKTLLGKVFYDKHQAKRAVEIYNEEITYFAKEKMAIGALLTWYLIAQATLITETPQKSLEIAQQALEIAQNPKINNSYFIVLIRTIIAKAYMGLGDYESAKINIETALSIAKKFEMNDLLSKLYLLYGQYYQEILSSQTSNKSEYIKAANMMFERALNIVNSITNNLYVKKQIEEIKNNITFC